MPDGSSITSEYDARGRNIKQTDQNGYVTSFTYDGVDRLTSVKDSMGGKWIYTYNEIGELVSVTDANNEITKYEYDLMGRVTSMTNPLGSKVSITYDETGNVLTFKDFKGNTTNFIYDELDRLIVKEVGDQKTTFTYTTDGMLSSVTDRNGTTEYTYNTMNGLINTKLPSGVTLRYEYDDAQRLTKVDTAYGKTNYEYDKLNRLIRVVDHNGSATVYEYDENGNRSAVRYANGMIDRYEYDTLNRLISLKTLDRDENTIAKYLYTLGDAGERLKVEEQDREVLYEYDALYRLTKETIIKEDDITEISYTYDSVGNRLKKVHDGIITEYTYNGLNQLLTENDIEYSYDLNGNLISKTGPDEEVIYTYDFENRLIKAVIKKEGSITTEEYQYDWAGNRVSKISDGIEIKYVVDTNGWLSQVIAELDGDGNLKTFYTRGEDLISLCKEDEIRYYLYDGNGSVRMLADEAGVISDTYTYDAFGNLIDTTGSTENSFLYTGEQFDFNTGFYYLRARYMNPNTGTFITMDPYQGSLFDPVSLHKYLYANANPIMYSDQL